MLTVFAFPFCVLIAFGAHLDTRVKFFVRLFLELVGVELFVLAVKGDELLVGAFIYEINNSAHKI